LTVPLTAEVLQPGGEPIGLVDENQEESREIYGDYFKGSEAFTPLSHGLLLKAAKAEGIFDFIL
jgi:hypothetical protein